MTLRNKIGITLLGTFLFAPGASMAQEPEMQQEAEATTGTAVVEQQAADDYVEVWSVIEEQWDAAQRGDKRWVEQLLSADFIGWPNNSPAPRDRASTRLWNEFETKQFEGLTHELYPLSTVIHGDTAIAHYLYTNATENNDGETKVVNGRYTDILVRVDGDWKFISWHGGADATDD